MNQSFTTFADDAPEYETTWPFPLHVLDAACWPVITQFTLTNGTETRTSRTTVTLGSVTYTVSLINDTALVRVYLEAMSHDDTRVTVETSAEGVPDQVPEWNFPADIHNQLVSRLRAHPLLQSPERQCRPAGRRSYPDDDWAYAQIYRYGRRKPDVFREWYDRIGPERRESLEDAEKAFEKTIYRRRKQGRWFRPYFV